MTSVCLLRCNLYKLHCQDCDTIHVVRMRSQISPMDDVFCQDLHAVALPGQFDCTF